MKEKEKNYVKPEQENENNSSDDKDDQNKKSAKVHASVGVSHCLLLKIVVVIIKDNIITINNP